MAVLCKFLAVGKVPVIKIYNLLKNILCLCFFAFQLYILCCYAFIENMEGEFLNSNNLQHLIAKYNDGIPLVTEI